MIRTKILLAAIVIMLGAEAAFAQKQELGITIGGLRIGQKGVDIPTPETLDFSTGFTYEINYARRFLDARLASLYVEFPFAGTPTTKINSTSAFSPRSYSSLFFTPGIKLK